MTRVNVVPVKELSDQWLIAEYRELPRVLKQQISIENASDNYILGKGHVKWAKKHSLFTFNRYNIIIKEMHFRGFKVNFSNTLDKYINDEFKNHYKVTGDDIQLNRNRLTEKYNKNPTFYRWTRRKKPNYLKNSLLFHKNFI